MFFIHSPLEQFTVITMVDFFDIMFTNLSLYWTLVQIVFVVLFDGIYNIVVKGSIWTAFQEAIYDTVNTLVNNQIGGSRGGEYFPLSVALFVTIGISNLIGMVPYSVAVTAQMLSIVGLSFLIWLGVTLTGLHTQGIKFFGLFVPQGCPLILTPLLVLIETLSYGARAISLGLRLSANTLSGHLLMAILGGLLYNVMTVNFSFFIAGFIPLLIILAIVCLEFAIALIQSYVFTILAASYVKDSLYGH